MSHKWAEPDREVYATYQKCKRCPVVMVTRHDGDFPWTEFTQGGVLIDTPFGRRPKCEPVEREDAAKERAPVGTRPA